MEKQIYGNITNTARTQFQFDKIYSNRAAMDDACLNDGIYAGRYVLVEYDENPARGATELIKKGANLFYYKDFENVQAIPGKTVAVGQIYYTVDEFTGKHSFYEGVEIKNEDGTITPQFNLLTTSPSLDNYDTNWRIDYSKYKRGFDSTVWQKVYDKGSQVYIMVAELNTVVPNFTISADAPTETALAPHIDDNSTNLNVNIHMPTQWGMRVAAAENNNLSDEKVEHEYIKYVNGEEVKEIKENIPANIFYNREGLSPYEYIKIIISDTDSVYEPGQYYYRVDQGVFKKYTEKEYQESFDFKIFYKVKDGIPEEDWPEHYTNLNNLDEIKLVNSHEIKYKPGKFYVLSSQIFKISLTAFKENEIYFIRKKDEQSEDGYIFEPVDITEREYDERPGEYYIREFLYELESDKAIYSETKQYFKLVDGQYILLENVVNKPEYEPNKYYAWVDYYYTIDHSLEEVRDRQYYTYNEKTGEYIPIYFNYRRYIPYTYYYKEDEEYILDRDQKYIEGREYYRKALPVIREGQDKVIVLPTGTSGRLYNDCAQSKAVQDIQEISILLPSVGRTIAEVWNLMYGQKKNDLIYSTPFYDSTMYKESGEPLYESNFNTFVGLINKMHDLIGHNVINLINEESISIDNKDNSVIINNQKSNIINKENLDKYIYSINGKNYRAILNGDKILLIPMNSVENSDEMDNIYEVLLEIQKTLGMNENASIVNSNSVKGALLHLNEIIDSLSEGIEFITIGAGLGSEHTRVFRDIDGNYVSQEYNPNTFVAAKDYYEYFIDHHRKKELIIYSKTQASVNSDTFGQGRYWIETKIDEKIKYILAENFIANTVYYIFEKIGRFTEAPKKEDLNDKYIIELPRYYIEVYNEDENRNERIYKDHLNVLEDVIDLDRYAIYHEDPAPSSNNNLNKTYSSLKVENGYSVSSGINVNGKGHIYGESSNYILPQAIVSATAPANVPIGTLWYDTSTNS